MTVEPRIAIELRKTLPWAQDVSLRRSVDESGDAALVVFLLVDTDLLGDADKVAEARRAVSEAFARHGVPSWPYVRFVSEPVAGATGT